jgi:hypothetical protein
MNGQEGIAIGNPSGEIQCVCCGDRLTPQRRSRHSICEVRYLQLFVQGSPFAQAWPQQAGHPMGVGLILE